VGYVCLGCGRGVVYIHVYGAGVLLMCRVIFIYKGCMETYIKTPSTPTPLENVTTLGIIKE
jgi:hypothetical protein